MNKRLVGWILLCWLVGGLGFLFQIKGVREGVRQQAEGGWEIVHKFLGQRAPGWQDYPDFRASGERVPKGVSRSSIGGSRGEKETGLPGPSPRRSDLSGRNRPRRSSDTHSTGSYDISFFRPRIIDGDTIRHKRRKIRLNGIDAPERGQPYGSEATRALARKLRRGKVTCRLEGKDRYGRHLGTCYVKGKSVNEWMVRNGYAWSYWLRRYRRQEELARRERKGVHRSRSAIRPEQWRRRRG